MFSWRVWIVQRLRSMLCQRDLWCFPAFLWCVLKGLCWWASSHCLLVTPFKTHVNKQVQFWIWLHSRNSLEELISFSSRMQYESAQSWRRGVVAKYRSDHVFICFLYSSWIARKNVRIGSTQTIRSFILCQYHGLDLINLVCLMEMVAGSTAAGNHIPDNGELCFFGIHKCSTTSACCREG